MDNAQFPTSSSPDGQMLLFTDEHPDTNLDVWFLPLGADRQPQPFARTEFNETAARFSPDGRCVAYQSDQSGRFEIYARPFRGNGVNQISTDGGTGPVWAPNGRELFYRNADKMMAVAVQTILKL